MASEKEILRDRLARCERLATEVKQFGPANVRNPVLESRIGRYRSLDSRMCATVEMEIIKKYLNKKNQDPPGFLEAGPREYLYFDPENVRVGIVTPGGVAPGVNTVIHSIVNMHIHPDLYGGHNRVYGFRGGFAGLLEEKPKQLTYEETRDWIHKGGTELFTGLRKKPDIPTMVKYLEYHGVNILYVVGGDGSLTAAHLIAKEIEDRDEDIVVAGVPKTMDNDILWVWRSFGFDTAAEEATRAINAIHDDAKSTGRICLLQLFGRDAGFVAAHATLASGLVDVVLVPEVRFRVRPLIEYVKEVLLDKNYALLVIAEGAEEEDYSEDYIRERLRREGYDPDNKTDPRVHEVFVEGRLIYLKDKFDEEFSIWRGGRHRVFVNQPRHLIRAVPANAVDQTYCHRLADMVVHNALAGFTDFMISQWLTEYILVPLELVTEGTKSIPADGIFWKTVITSTGQPPF